MVIITTIINIITFACLVFEELKIFIQGRIMQLHNYYLTTGSLECSLVKRGKGRAENKKWL